MYRQKSSVLVFQNQQPTYLFKLCKSTTIVQESLSTYTLRQMHNFSHFWPSVFVNDIL